MRYQKAIRGTALAAILLLIATACSSSKSDNGGGSDSSGGSSSTPVAGSSALGSSAATSGTPINIGTIGSYTGPESGLSAGLTAIKAWVSYTNANGGIAGHPVKLFVADDGDVAAKALTGAKTLIEQNHVVAIVGDFSDQDSTFASYVASKGVPVVGGLALNFTFMTNPSFFANGTNLFAVAYSTGTIAKTLGTKMAYFYCAEAPVCAQGAPIWKAGANAQGVDVPISQGLNSSSTSFAPQCAAMKSAGVHSYFVGEPQAIVAKMAADCKAAGLTATLIGSDGEVDSCSATNAGLQGIQISELDFPFSDASTPATQQFQAAIKQYAPNYGCGLGPYSAYAWTSGQLFAAAVKASNSTDVTSDSIKQGLYALPKGTTLDGLTPPLTFTAGQAAHVNCYFIMGIANNKFTEPQGLKTSCVPDAFVDGLLKAASK